MRLDDFYHLPALAAAFARLTADQPGLIVVAGLDLPFSAAASLPLPSGRVTIFRVLADALLEAGEARAALIAADAAAYRVPRAHRQRVTSLRVQRNQGYGSLVSYALTRGARLLLLDQLTPDGAALIVPAVGAGARVLTQLNTPARGTGLLRELEGLAAGEQPLPERMWLVAVRRVPMLCAHCRRAQPLSPAQRLQLQHHAAGLSPDEEYYVADGCEHCQGQGRSGMVALFDLRCLARERDGLLSLEAVLPLEQYAQALAEAGALAFDDVAGLDDALTGQIVRQFAASQQQLGSTNQTLERKLAELHSANEVLQQRTSALLSFQTIGQALISSTDLPDLARRVCRHVRELCNADRAALYGLNAPAGATILAVSGWDTAHTGREVDGAELTTDTSEPTPYKGWPPGIPQQHADVAGGALRAGLCVPLIAEGAQVGMLIIHVMRRPSFEAGEIALLQTFAHQAALLIERTRLLDDLSSHIVRLQAAQAALVEQQRLEREMELAAEVQRSILPRVFPQVPGLAFAADNHPARQVGGDCYDVFALDATTIGIVIADVSGKGMPAALYMALTRSLLLAEARRERSPQAVLLNVNRLLREVGDPHMFVTVFYGTIDTASRRLTYARAGHDYPLLLRGDTVEQLMGKGLVLGILDLEAEQLAEQQLELRHGDRLVLYTDGLTDVLNEAGQRLELPRLTELLHEQRHTSPEAICERTFAALHAFQGAAEQFDDMTIVVVGVSDSG